MARRLKREKLRFRRRLAHELREARLNAGLTQAEIARPAGVGRTTIVNIEGETQGCSVFVLVKWAEACQVDETDILERC